MLRESIRKWLRVAETELAAQAPPAPPAEEERAQIDGMFAVNMPSLSGMLGLADQTEVSQRDIRRYHRGLFATLIRMRADAIAAGMLEAAVVRMTAQLEAEPVEMSHPWLRLLRRPNPYRSALDVWRWAAMARDLQGSADFIVATDGRGMPIGLYEIFPAFGRLRPVPSGDGGVASYVFHRYSDGKPVPLERSDVVRLRHPDPATPYETASLLERAAWQLDKVLYQDTYERDTLREGRFPPVVLKSDQPISKPQADQYGKAFKDNYMVSGRSTVKGVPIMGNGLTPHIVSLNAADLALIDSRKLTTTELFYAAGVPEGILSDKSNRANADAARATFAQYTVQPEVEALAAQLTLAFETAFKASPGVLMIQAPDVVPVDREQQARIDETQIRSGTALINEIRTRDGKGDVQGGDKPLISAGLMRLEELGSFSSAGRAAEKGARTGELLILSRSPIVRAADLEEITSSDLAVCWRAIDRRKLRAERPIQAAMAQAFREQKADTIRRLRDVTRSRDQAAPEWLTADAIFDLEAAVRRTLELLGRPLDDSIRKGFATGALRVDLDMDFVSHTARTSRAIHLVNAKAQNVPQTTLDAINDLIQRKLTVSATVNEIAEGITQLFNSASIVRAKMIAQTAGTAGFEAGKLEAWEEADLEAHAWLTQRDGAVRDAHIEADGQIVEIGEAFDIGGEALEYPADPAGSAWNVIRCRCTTIPAEKPEKK